MIAAGLILGGLIGLGLSFLFPPVYEARFEVVTNIDLVSNPNVTELMMDVELMHVGELAYSQSVIDGVIAAEKQNGINLDQSELLKISTVERQITSTYLKVQWRDAATAAQIANTWGNLYYAALKEGERQSLVAAELAKRQTDLQDCLAGTATNQTAPICTGGKSELESQLAANTQDLASAQELSLGLSPELTVDSYQEATVPGSPIRGERGWLVGAGAVIGFILALLVTEGIYSPARISHHE